MQPIPLSPEQVAFFQTFGYLSLPGLLADRAGQMINDFEEVFAGRGGGHAGKPHEGKARSCIVAFADQHEGLCSLLDDPRVLGLARSLLGEDFNYMGSDGNYYVGDTGWHSDGAHKDLLHIKIALYLDPLTRDTGALRVIPGSHFVGDKYGDSLTSMLSDSKNKLGVDASEVPAVALETAPGDVAVFNHNTKHAAFGGGQWRRMFTLNLCQRYPDERIQELKDYISHAARFWLDRVYGEKMVSTANPQRLRHLEQIMANDGHLAELSRKARQTMKEPSRG